MENSEAQQAKVETLNKEIALLSSQLKEFSSKKESKYKEKETKDLELNGLIKTAQELRDKKLKIDSEVKALKQVRDADNKGLKEYYNKLAEQKVQQTAVTDKIKVRPNPAALKKQIESMSYSIETECLSFEKEKTYMDKIKRLKVMLVEIDKEDAKYAEVRKLRTEITGKKREADDAHDKIQTLAAESSGIFAQLKEKSDAITKAKKARAAIQIEIKSLKAQLEEIDSKLVSTLAEWSELTKQAPKMHEGLPAGVSEMEQLKTKKKFTKDDILAMQKSAMRRR
ncbi:MAG: hypothetical protein V1839_02805 [archaeon]